MMQLDLQSEHDAGVLCEQGFMKEIYSKSANDLIRTFTPSGISKVKDILKDPAYQKEFVNILNNEVIGLPVDAQRGIVLELQLMLQ